MHVCITIKDTCIQSVIITGLSNRMKERRKQPKPRKPHSETQSIIKKENPKRPAMSQNQIDVPVGEDQTSFE